MIITMKWVHALQIYMQSPYRTQAEAPSQDHSEERDKKLPVFKILCLFEILTWESMG